MGIRQRTFAVLAVAFVCAATLAAPGPAGAAATCRGSMATITGSGTIVGTTGDDVIVGSSGPDNIDGNGGNDLICGRGGADTLRAGPGAGSTLIGGSGNDVIIGGPGNDIIRGGTGSDSLSGDDGDDQIWGNRGPDGINGGAGNDIIRGGADNDFLVGDHPSRGPNGNDVIRGVLERIGSPAHGTQRSVSTATIAVAALEPTSTRMARARRSRASPEGRSARWFGCRPVCGRDVHPASGVAGLLTSGPCSMRFRLARMRRCGTAMVSIGWTPTS